MYILTVVGDRTFVQVARAYSVVESYNVKPYICRSLCRGDLLSMSLSFIQRPCMHHTECQTTLPCTMHWSDTECLYYWSPSRQSCSLTIADFAPNTILKYKFNPCKMGISLFWTSGRWSVKKHTYVQYSLAIMCGSLRLIQLTRKSESEPIQAEILVDFKTCTTCLSC